MQRKPVRTASELGGWKYQRHQPEKTLLYQIIAQHYPVFKETHLKKKAALKADIPPPERLPPMMRLFD